jgi:predicted MFS family arabinose efflux permease
VHLWHTLATVAVVLLWLHLRRASDPLVPLDLLRRRSVLTGTTLMACAAGTLICAFLLCSLLLQERLGHSALRTGLEFLPAAVATVVTARAAARVLGTWGSRRVAVLALAVAGAGAVALAVVADAGPVPVVLALALLASGVGAVFVIAGTTIMSGMGQGEAGVLAGLSTTAHELGAGAVLALALAVAIVADGVDLPAGFLSLAVVVAVALGAAVAGLRPTDGIGARGGFVH